MKVRVLPLFVLACIACTGLAQPGSGDPVAESLFPPELVMQHQKKLQLSGSQREGILQEITQAQSQVMTLQWELQSALEEFKALLSKPQVDEARALQELESILQSEAQVKRTHLRLAIRIKNTLTPEQQAFLETRRSTFRKPAGGERP